MPVSFSAADGREVLPPFDRSGSCLCSGIEPGEYVVTATLDGGKQERRIVVTAGGTATADFARER